MAEGGSRGGGEDRSVRRPGSREPAQASEVERQPRRGAHTRADRRARRVCQGARDQDSWSGGITAPQALELARRRVFGIFSTSSTAAKMAVSAQFERDPRLAAENEPTEFGVRRMHAIIQGGFLSSRIRELDAGLARELETSTANLVANSSDAAKSEAALTALNALLVRGWRQLRDAIETDGQAYLTRGSRLTGSAARPVPADAVRVFRGRKIAAASREDFVRRLEQVFMPLTVQMQRLYGLTAYLPAVLPESSSHTLPDEVALVFYRTQGCYHEAKQCIGGRAYSELHELAFDMPASRSGFPQLLDHDQFTPDQPYNLFERSVDWQTGGTRLFVGTRKTDTPSDAFLAGIAKAARRVQRSRSRSTPRFSVRRAIGLFGGITRRRCFRSRFHTSKGWPTLFGHPPPDGCACHPT